MANTLKTLLFSVLLTGLSFAASAQRTFPDSVRVGAGIEAGLVNGVIGEQYKSFYGASVRLDYPVLHKLYLTANIGYSIYSASSSYNGGQAITGVKAASMQTIPVKLGIKYLLFDGFYVQGEAGQTILANRKEVYGIYNRSLTIAPQFGMLFPLKTGAYIDGGIRYEKVASFYNTKEGYDFWALHITYAFKL